eukprot:gene12705-26761_t
MRRTVKLFVLWLPVLPLVLIVNSLRNKTLNLNHVLLSYRLLVGDNQCDLTSPGQVYSFFQEFSTLNSIGAEIDTKSIFHRGSSIGPVMVHSPCFVGHSLGNFLTHYLEVRLCAETVGLHYLASRMDGDAVSRSGRNYSDQIFLSSVPTIALHPDPSTSYDVSSLQVHRTCSCRTFCHEQESALVFQHFLRSSQIFTDIVNSYVAGRGLDLKGGQSLVNASYSSSKYIQKNGTGTTTETEIDMWFTSEGTARLVPDAAIHYRCSDSQWGLLPFRVFRDILLPHNVSSIYVLTEHPNRRGSVHPVQARRCQTILLALSRYLSQSFPLVEVLLLQGGDIHLDMVRLAKSKVLVCSPSTYCLWPAMGHRRSAHFPVTRLIAHGKQIPLGPHFFWISSPRLVTYDTQSRDEMYVQHILRLLMN